MLANLQKIMGNIPRHAENADTRQEIRRQNPDDPSRNKEKDTEDENIMMEDDHAVVSVQALKMFLENFLKSQRGEEQNAKTTTPKNDTTKPVSTQSRPQTTNETARRAANAYANNTRTTTPSYPTSNTDNNSKTLLGGEDIRVIHQLLTDIKHLETKNIDFLKIEKADTFLKSLTAAVQKAL